METTHTPAPEISPITANLLSALRSYEMAVSSYYEAASALRHGWAKEELTPEEQSTFDAGRALIEKLIGERLILWANTTTPAAPL